VSPDLPLALEGSAEMTVLGMVMLGREHPWRVSWARARSPMNPHRESCM
jgi:hypothetical protein